MDLSSLPSLTFADVEKLLSLNPSGTLPLNFATQISHQSPEGSSPSNDSDDSSPSTSNRPVVGQKRKSIGEDDIGGRATATSLKDRKANDEIGQGVHSHNEDSESKEDDSNPNSRRGPGKTSAKRKEQNRNAQRAFRERKEKHLKELEDQVNELEKKNSDQVNVNQNLKDLVSHLQRENSRLKVYEAAFTFNFQKDASTTSTSVPKPTIPQSNPSVSIPSLFSTPLSPPNQSPPPTTPAAPTPSNAELLTALLRTVASQNGSGNGSGGGSGSLNLGNLTLEQLTALSNLLNNGSNSAANSGNGNSPGLNATLAGNSPVSIDSGSPASSRMSPPALGNSHRSSSVSTDISSLNRGSMNSPSNELSSFSSIFGSGSVSSPRSASVNNGLFDLTPFLSGSANNNSGPSTSSPSPVTTFSLSDLQSSFGNFGSTSTSDLFNNFGGSPATSSGQTPPANSWGLLNGGNGLEGGSGWTESLNDLKSYTSYKPPTTVASPSVPTNIEDLLGLNSSFSSSFGGSSSSSSFNFDFPFAPSASSPSSSTSILTQESKDSLSMESPDALCPILSQAKALGGTNAGFTFDLDLLCSDLKAKATCSEKAKAALAAAVNEDLGSLMMQ